jgi:hypothetical protein
VSVGESAVVTGQVPTATTWDVTLSSGICRYRMQVMGNYWNTKLFAQGAGLVAR